MPCLHWISGEGADFSIPQPPPASSVRSNAAVRRWQSRIDEGGRGGGQRGAMAAGGGCGELVDRYRADVERLTQELAEANQEKIRAAEYGLVVLEENHALKQKYVDLETDQETLRKELEQLQEVGGRGAVAL